jgi:soluble P-type ATPase
VLRSEEGREAVHKLALAVVFDGAGVIYAPYRIIKDMARGIVKRSRVSGITCTDYLAVGALVILKTRYEETLEREDPARLLAAVLAEKKIEIKVIYKKEEVSDEAVQDAIFKDQSVKLGDVHDVVARLRQCEILPVLGVGLIMDMSKASVRYLIAGGINLFPGTRSLFKDLREWGIPTFIASGDRIERDEVASYLPEVPPENVFGMMKPEDKRDLVRRLRDRYRVVMVGDDRNDYLAMLEADIAVLSLQEEAMRAKELFEVADVRIREIGELRGILEEIGG